MKLTEAEQEMAKKIGMFYRDGTIYAFFKPSIGDCSNGGCSRYATSKCTVCEKLYCCFCDHMHRVCARCRKKHGYRKFARGMDEFCHECLVPARKAYIKEMKRRGWARSSWNLQDDLLTREEKQAKKREKEKRR